jgi:hypothetical protein
MMASTEEYETTQAPPLVVASQYVVHAKNVRPYDHIPPESGQEYIHIVTSLEEGLEPSTSTELPEQRVSQPRVVETSPCCSGWFCSCCKRPNIRMAIGCFAFAIVLLFGMITILVCDVLQLFG